MSLRIPILVFLVLALGFSVFFLLPVPSKADIPTVTAQTINCTLGSCPRTLSNKDTGKTLIYPLAEQLTVVLNDSVEPRSELACTPSGILTPLAIAPPATYPYYALKFKIAARGTCVLHSGNFSATITAARFR